MPIKWVKDYWHREIGATHFSLVKNTQVRLGRFIAEIAVAVFYFCGAS